ncbi:MAG: thiamine biosynthesis protein ThiF, partial [Gammaproteobacteria bacterium]|nr:thiamine biosynthesis protein ThiF [Gammaproteobacteria bacterium]
MDVDNFDIDFTPTYRALLGEVRDMQLYLVGAGGTGSALADALARLLYHARQKGMNIGLTIIDPDTISEANLGRQRFCRAEIGYEKALSLCLRLNAAFGLDIRAIAAPFQPEMALS